MRQRRDAASPRDEAQKQVMTPVQQRVIRALDGAPFEDQLAALGFAMVFLLNTACSSPLEEFERLSNLMRALLVSDKTPADGNVH